MVRNPTFSFGTFSLSVTRESVCKTEHIYISTAVESLYLIFSAVILNSAMNNCTTANLRSAGLLYRGVCNE